MAETVSYGSGDRTKRVPDYGQGTAGDNTLRVTFASDDTGLRDLLRAIQALPSISSYETIAASQTLQVLGNAGAAGDYLDQILIVPATTAAGTITITDGNRAAITIFATGTLADLTPFSVKLGVRSISGPWQITTGANVSAIAIGTFS